MPVPIPVNDMATSHSPAQSWSFRVPSPPRVTVPPPPLNARGIPDLHVVQDSPFDFESSGFDNAEFLRTVTYGNLIYSNNMLVRSHSSAELEAYLIDIWPRNGSTNNAGGHRKFYHFYISDLWRQHEIRASYKEKVLQWS